MEASVWCPFSVWTLRTHVDPSGRPDIPVLIQVIETRESSRSRYWNRILARGTRVPLWLSGFSYNASLS